MAEVRAPALADLVAWAVRLFACRHRNTIQERRRVSGPTGLVPGDVVFVDVLHTVCLDCGRAWAIVDRTAAEHRRALDQVRPLPRATRRNEP